jgi:SAM-dependent methyltransferase
MPEYALQLSEPELARYRFMAERAREHERDLWATAGIVEGADVADVGCGPGATSLVLAETVGATGTVRAVDRDASARAAARALLGASGLDNARVLEGDAMATGLEPGCVDVVMMRHVLAHNGGREQEIVDHLAGLVRPGGCVYLVDVEGSAVRMHPTDPDLAELGERYLGFHRARGNDLMIGLRLGELLTGAGLDLVAYRGWYDIFPGYPGMRSPAWAARDAMVAEGAATEADIARWAAAFERADAAPTPTTVFVPTFVGIGRRPA